MDYSVGSIADLISGTKTANKTAVVQQEFKNLPKKKKSAVVKKSKDLHVVSDSVISNETQENTVGANKKNRKRPASVIPEDGESKKLKIANKNETNKKPAVKKTPTNQESAEKRIKKKINMEIEEGFKDRTIFVGNIPISVPKDKLKKYFMKFGNVESVRIRGIPVADPRIPKKVAYIKGEFHPDRNSLHCYVRYSSSEEAQKALQLNGQVYKNHHLRVVMSGVKKTSDDNKAIFVGNIPFSAEDEDLWKLFESCGKISSVRLIRDSATGMGKGFGYVNFEDSDAVELALQMERPVLKERELRVSVYKGNAPKKDRKRGPPKKQFKQRSDNQPKDGDGDQKDPSVSPSQKKKKSVKSDGETERTKPTSKKTDFAGVKIAEKKKKKGVNKGILQKKKMSKKFAPKPKTTA